MTPEQLRNKELDKLLHHVLSTSEEFSMPDGLSEKAIRKLEKKVLLRELLLELSFKVVLVLGSLAVLGGVLALANKTGVLNGLYSRFASNWQAAVSLLLLAFFTILIDQVGLRFYTANKKEVSFKI